jgi:DNA-binding Lrp family transcriptional regulator
MKSAKNRAVRARRIPRRFGFVFIDPKENVDSNEVAEKLIAIENVEEVFVTEGDYGYLVKVRLDDEADDKKFVDYMKRNVSQRLGAVTSYYSIKR